MRYAIERKAVAVALIGQGVALAKAGVLRRSRRRLIAAHERVRRDIATQLHDDVQEKLFVLKDHLQELLNGINSASEATQRICNVIDRLDRKIERQVGVLSRQLYPSTLSAGLVPAFQSFRDQFEAALTIEIELDEELVKQEQADCSLLPEQVGLAAYRIAEEALTNVVKHANASKVIVRLDSSREGWLRLTVRDDGQGFDVQDPPQGLGLGTMQDYAEAADGECSVHSDPGVGTEVTAVLPLSQPDAEHAEQLVASEKGGN
jgi:signal transduction histidine kinase